MLRFFKSGFTLAELLIALAILGVIATFTIPKVLTANQNGQYKAIGKETAGMLSGALQAIQLEGALSSTTQPMDLTPYMNYVKIDTTTPIDDWQTGDDYGCDSTTPCIQLHNGARLLFGQDSFDGTNTNSFIEFQLDPDGKYGNSTNGPGKAVDFVLYYNGVIRTKGTMYPGSVNASGTYNPDAIYDPPWFSWD